MPSKAHTSLCGEFLGWPESKHGQKLLSPTRRRAVLPGICLSTEKRSQFLIGLILDLGRQVSRTSLGDGFGLVLL